MVTSMQSRHSFEPSTWVKAVTSLGGGMTAAATETAGFDEFVIICVATTSGTGDTESGNATDEEQASDGVVVRRRFSRRFLTVTLWYRGAVVVVKGLLLLISAVKGGFDEGMEIMGIMDHCY